jgi:hypothetical protein
MSNNALRETVLAPRDAGIRWLAGVGALLLSACASAPQPYCLPPEATRAPEASSGTLGAIVPRSDDSAKEYARCKEMEADLRLEEKLRKDEALAKQREAEQLEQELREMEKQEQEPDGYKSD